MSSNAINQRNEETFLEAKRQGAKGIREGALKEPNWKTLNLNQIHLPERMLLAVWMLPFKTYNRRGDRSAAHGCKRNSKLMCEYSAPAGSIYFFMANDEWRIKYVTCGGRTHTYTHKVDNGGREKRMQMPSLAKKRLIDACN